jgi:hypothetical protein
VVLILAGITAGSLLSGPAVAHTGKKISHLTNHLDAIYLNENQKAADANQLDGLDSTAFLRSNGKAADADLLDGISSAGFLTASGKAVDSNLLDNLDSTAFLQFATTHARQTNCSGSGFYPVDGGNATEVFNEVDGERYLTPGTGALRCAVSLPNGATVTGVTFTVYDNDATEVTNCRLLRTDLTPPIGLESNVSTPVSSTGTPGGVTITAPSLVGANTTIDNAGFAYAFECTLNSGDVNNGIYGAVVSYNVTAANG